MNKQTGSAHAVIISVITIALIGGIGFMFWKNVLNKPALHDSTTIIKTISSPSPTTTPVAPTTKFLIVKEWGVQFPYQSNDTLQYYVLSPTVISIMSAQLLSADGNTGSCTTFHEGGGTIARGLADDPAETGATGPGPTWKEYYDNYGGSVAKLGNYFYGFIHDQANCNDDNDQQIKTNDLTESIVKNVQMIN